ncbi:MAG: hypothetical protein JO023_10975, partial [Chloroflexi bacterium]|nr:hypothetical protein [Chloroflexota bacterium]
LVFFVLGTLVEVVGSLLLALPMLRGSMRPRWAGYVLVVSAVLAAVSFFLNGPGSATNALTIALNIAPAALLVLVLGWLGYDLVTAPVAVTAEPAMEDAELARRAS